MRYDFCGNSSIRDSSGRIMVQANGNEIDFCAVESVDVHPVSPPPETVRSDISNRYLNSDYYIVQPPLVAKTFQALFYFGLQEVYETRRKQYTSPHHEE
jgi:hypothetical protein